MSELIIQSGKNKGKKLVLPNAEVVIGRDESCDIRLASTDVSRRHCRFRMSEDGMLVSDLGSQNGTWLNDVPIEGEILLRAGDRIRVGPMVLQVPKKKRSGTASGGGAGLIPGVASRPQPSESGSVLDDDIADWLSASGPNAVPDGGDTTIIPRSTGQPKGSPPPDEPAQPLPPPASKKQFRTLAEEAADVIRRHREMLAKQDADKSDSEVEAVS